MLFCVRAGIDDSDFAFANNVNACADISERAWIVRHNAAQKRRDLLHFSIFKFDFTHKRDSHGSKRRFFVFFLYRLGHICPDFTSPANYLRLGANAATKAFAIRRVDFSLSPSFRATGGPMSVLFASTM